MVLHKNQKQMVPSQHNTLFKKTLLAACIMAAGSVTYAQQSDEIVEEVLVTGTRASLQNAQDIKRNSAVSVDAISASDIGALPDKSVLESLQRVPGISIERYKGANDPDHFSIEGSGVTLRGLPQTRSEFNGRDSFSANSGRGLNFQDVPPEVMGKVEVFKSQSANMIEGGISGTINLNTRKPFDSSDRQIFVSAAANYSDLRDETKPSISALFSDRWDTSAGEFGFLASISKSELATRTDGLSYGQIGTSAGKNFERRTDVSINGQTLARYAPINARVTSSNQDRERLGGSLVGQWQNSADTLSATFEYFRSDADQSFLEHNVESDDQARQAILNPTANGLYVTSGRFTNINYTSTTRSQDRNSVVEDFSLALEFTPTDELTLKGDVQFIQATTDETDLSLMAGVNASTDLNFRDLDNPRVRMIAPTTSTAGSLSYFTNPANFFWRSAMDHVEDSEGDEFAIKLDAKYELDAGWAKSAEAGVRFSDREQDVKWSKYNWGNLSESWAGGQVPLSARSSSLYEQFSQGGFFRDGTGSGVGGGVILVPSEDLVLDYRKYVAGTRGLTRPGGYQTLGDRTIKVINPSGGADLEVSAVVPGSAFTLAEINPVSEENSAVYAQLNFGNDDDTVTGNVGLRLVRLENAMSGGTEFPNRLDLGSCGATCGNATVKAQEANFNNPDVILTSASNTFTQTLPSFNLRVAITDDIQHRFALYKAVAFPDLGNIRDYRKYYTVPKFTNASGQSVGAFESPTNVTFEHRGSQGSPNLKPMESVNIDASIEWYFADAGSLFAGLFFKDIKDYFGNEAILQAITNRGVTRNVLVDTPVNKGEARISGFEAGYQQFYDMLPAPFDGLGLQANFTLLDVSGTAPNGELDSATPPGQNGSFADLGTSPVAQFDNLPLQGMSDTTYNIVAMYEKDSVSARLAYNWRSEYLLTTRDVITALPIYAQNSGQLDGSIFYTINDNFKIGLEGSNLLDEITWTKQQVTQEGSVLPRNFFINDRRYSVVLRGTF